jgi:hypothetical protein
LRLKRRGRGNAHDGLLSANRRVCPGFAPSYGVYEERNPKNRKKDLFEKIERRMYWLDVTTRGCGVCKGASTCVWWGGDGSC